MTLNAGSGRRPADARRRPWRMLLAAGLALVASSATANTITVNSIADNQADDGVCTLREAIIAADTNTASGVTAGECAAGSAGLDTIVFNIPGAGVHTIAPGFFLPDVTEALAVNGYSQPGASANTNSLSSGINAVLLIEIDLTLASWDLAAAGTSVRGLVINRAGTNLFVDADNVTIAGNFLGTDPTGTIARAAASPIGDYDISVISGNNTLIGGPAAADRNLISGQGGVLCHLASTGTVIQGNYIGPDATGTVSLTVASAVGIANAANAMILGNLISGNPLGAIEATDSDVIQGNLIGTQKDGTSSLPNGGVANSRAIFLGGNSSTIGGSGAGEANVIAFNTAAGIGVFGNHFGNVFSQNSMHDNSMLGISLNNPSTSLPNDACDVDSGLGNEGQNYPVLTSAIVAAGNVTIMGTLNSTAGHTFHVEFFSNVTCNASGFGEGKTFLGSADVTTDAVTCNVTFGPLVFAIPGGETQITSTATDATDGTSEFSACVATGVAPPPTPTPTAGPPPPPTPTPGPGGAAVPTLEPLALVLLALAIAGAGLALLRRS